MIACGGVTIASALKEIQRLSAIWNCSSLNRAARVSKRFFHGQDRKNRSLTVAALIPDERDEHQRVLESRTRRFAAVILTLLLFCGCASKRVGPMTGRLLVELDEVWATAAASGNTDAVMDFWTESAVMFVPDLPAFYGKQAIREIIDRRPPGLVYEVSWTPSCAGVDERGSMAYTLGEGQVSSVDESGVLRKHYARYVAIWRQDGDRWRCAVKSWTPMPSNSMENR